MGRPREHDERTRAALLEAAERMVEEHGPDGLSIRALADEVGTTTRAVYSLFGSKAGVLTALAREAFALLAKLVEGAPTTDDPVQDLIEAGVLYRRFVLEHPSIYRLTFQRITRELEIDAEFVAARDRTWALLLKRFQRIADAGRLPDRTPWEAAIEFNAMCEGMANAELRDTTRLIREGQEERAWRRAFGTVFQGLAVGTRPARSKRAR